MQFDLSNNPQDISNRPKTRGRRQEDVSPLNPATERSAKELPLAKRYVDSLWVHAPLAHSHFVHQSFTKASLYQSTGIDPYIPSPPAPPYCGGPPVRNRLADGIYIPSPPAPPYCGRPTVRIVILATQYPLLATQNQFGGSELGRAQIAV